MTRNSMLRATNRLPQLVRLALSGLHHDRCVMWPDRLNPDGYPAQFSVGLLGVTHKVRAGTVVCQIMHGPPPPGMTHALHSCHNRACVSPRHLRWGNDADNVADRIKADRQASTLTADDVRAIRSLPRSYGWQRRAAVTFNVSEATISLIVANKTWTHVQ